MHQSDEYGKLLINGRIPLSKDVSRLLRLHHKTYDKTLIELILYGVLSKDENGVIFCKRMVKDEHIRGVRRKAGKLGGSPLLKQKVKQNIKQKPTPSSSSSPSIKKQTKKTDKITDIYNKYRIEINPLRKTKQRAIINLKTLSKKYSLKDLEVALLNYASTLNGTEPKYRKDPANFFGVQEKYFMDYLPDNFESTTEEPPEEFEAPI